MTISVYIANMRKEHNLPVTFEIGIEGAAMLYKQL